MSDYARWKRARDAAMELSAAVDDLPAMSPAVTKQLTEMAALVEHTIEFTSMELGGCDGTEASEDI